MKIAIASNPATDHKMVAGIISSAAGHEVAWTTSDEREILDLCREKSHDLLLLDISFSKKTSDCVRNIMDAAPCVILLMTSAVEGNEKTIFEAMRWGALDIATIPTSNEQEDSCKEFMRKIEIMSKLTKPGTSSFKQTISPTSLLAIGASTGGPNALRTILADFPADFEGHIVIVQHIDSEFLPGLATWLNEHIDLDVDIARHGDKLEKGKVLIARGPDDLIITKNKTLHYVRPAQDDPFHPSIDTFFNSCVDNLNETGISVILSGMGKDGATGMKAMSDAGWETIAQDEATSAIYGMPKEAAAIGAAKHILPVESIAQAILGKMQSK